MNKKELFQKTISNNIDTQKKTILNNVLNRGRIIDLEAKTEQVKSPLLRYSAVFALVILLICSYVFSGSLLFGNTTPSNTKPSQQGGTVPIRHVFAVAAYAAEKTVDVDQSVTVLENTRTDIIPNMKVVLPSGKIKRKNYGSNVYGCEYSGDVSISIYGEDIKSITLTSSTGELRYFDVINFRETKKNICEFTVKESEISDIPYSKDPPNFRKKFEKLWDSGYFADIQEKHFIGRNKKLKNYGYGMQLTDVDGEIFINIHENSVGYPLYLQKGKSITVEYQPELGADSFRNISWTPTLAMDKIGLNKPIKYEELPSDTVTVSAEFTDGQILTKTIILSFNEDGRVVAELKE